MVTFWANKMLACLQLSSWDVIWLFRCNLRLLQRTRWSSWPSVDVQRAFGACRRRQYTSWMNRQLKHNRVQRLLASYSLVQRVHGATHDAGGTLWCHVYWSAIADCRHSWRRPVRSPSAAMIDPPMPSGYGLYDVCSQMLEIIRSRHVPGRPADVRLVRRSVLQWLGQLLTRIALRLDHHRAAWPTGSCAVYDLASTPVVLVVRRRISWGRSGRSSV